MFLRVSVVEEPPEDVVTEVVEAPQAPAVGGSMLFLVLGEVIFIIVLDANIYHKIITKKIREIRRGKFKCKCV